VSRDPASRRAVTLANWRAPGHLAWSLQHVREIVPTAPIAERRGEGRGAPSDHPALDAEAVLPGGGRATMRGMLEGTRTTALRIHHRGAPVLDWSAPWREAETPHLVFSVTKSLTGLMAELLADDGLLDREAPVSAHMAGLAPGSAYATARVGHLLDMSVSSAFREDYTEPEDGYGRYRSASGWRPIEGGGTADLAGFLAEMPAGEEPHGTRFRYLSPNSDMLGLVVEHAAGMRFADLVRARLWQPMGGLGPASITLDGHGVARAAGGLSATAEDLALMGECVLGHHAVLPEAVVARLHGAPGAPDPEGTWARGDLAHLLPGGGYRSQWYRTGLASGAMAAIGIHGQWVWTDPAADAVIVRLAADPEPVSDATDLALIACFAALCRALG
jgi:hypothetical protein